MTPMNADLRRSDRNNWVRSDAPFFVALGVIGAAYTLLIVPTLVIGLSLLILFQTAPGRWIQQYVSVTYAIPAVILAQFSVAAAFAVRTMRVTFDQISPRSEQVAMTLGCTRGQAFWRVAIPEAWRGILTAGTSAHALA